MVAPPVTDAARFPGGYCKVGVPGGIGLGIGVDFTKIVPGVSVAKARLPVAPETMGSALAKNDEARTAAAPLQLAWVTSMVSDEAFLARVNV